MASSEGQTVGFYGKLPALGDFVGRRLVRDFVTPWDDWLQLAMAASRSQLGDAWLETYLTSPLWRFALSSGVCGGDACGGVLMPSVDRVGRYFPLALVGALPPGASLPEIAGGCGDWFSAAESLLLSTLDEETEFDLDAFDAQVVELGAPRAPPSEAFSADGDDLPLRLPLANADDVGGSWPAVVATLARRHLGNYSLWWTAGSEQVEPSLLLCTGLPAPECYASMLDGAWSPNAADIGPMPDAATDDGAPRILDAGFPEQPA